MDIDLLAKMLKEVVMDHDTVTLPGMGSFVAELVPATFADRGYTILPPYRRLYFSPKQGEDRLLAQLYAKSNDVSEADATRILEDFIAEMKEVLKQRKTLILTGLGRLRATRENHFFFVADEDLDIYPSGFGLKPISLKTHEETPEEVATAVSNLATILESTPEPEPEPTPEPEPIPEPEPTPEPELIPEPEPVQAEEPSVSPEASAHLLASGETEGSEAQNEAQSRAQTETQNEAQSKVQIEAQPNPKPSPWRKFWRFTGRTVLVLLILALIAAIALVVLGRVAPEWLDQFLYSPEELDILRN